MLPETCRDEPGGAGVVQPTPPLQNPSPAIVRGVQAGVARSIDPLVRIGFRSARLKGTINPALRFAVLKKCGFACSYCGQKAPDVTLEIDHITPRAAGGTDAPENLTAACTTCNAGKGTVKLGAREEAVSKETAVFLLRDQASQSLREALEFACNDAAAWLAGIVSGDDPMDPEDLRTVSRDLARFGMKASRLVLRAAQNLDAVAELEKP